MSVQRPGGQQSTTPFVTRRSTLAFSAVCVISGFVFQSLVGPGGATDSGLLAALSGALLLVTGAVAWIAGVVLALRAGSLLWTVIAALPFPPLNSVVCAVFCPAGPGEQRR